MGVYIKIDFEDFKSKDYSGVSTEFFFFTIFFPILIGLLIFENYVRALYFLLFILSGMFFLDEIIKKTKK